MTVKEYLKQIRQLDARIMIALDEVENYELIVYSVPSPPLTERVQTSTDPDRMTAKIAKLADLRAAANEKANRLIDARAFIISQIERLESPAESELLFRRYVKGEKWEAIAEGMNYSVEHVKRKLHGNALADFEKAFRKKFKKF